jgi:hypothetical protein
VDGYRLGKLATDLEATRLEPSYGSTIFQYESFPKPTKQSAQNLCLDKGYDYDEVRELAVEFGCGA